MILLTINKEKYYVDNTSSDWNAFWFWSNYVCNEQVIDHVYRNYWLAVSYVAMYLPYMFSQVLIINFSLRRNIMWTTPSATEMRFGFEVTMYVMNK
jgi:pyrroloquinoline quinone biosynthesis protein A